MSRLRIILIFSAVIVLCEHSFIAQEIDISILPWCTQNDEFAASFSDDSIYYCSRKRIQLFSAVEDAQGMYQTNLYCNSFNSKLSEGDRLVFSADMRQTNFGPSAIDVQGGYLYATMSVSEGQGKDEKAMLGIYRYTKNADVWSAPERFIANDSDGMFDVAHPFISADGLKFYFASNMPGGYGGKDIYVCSKEGDGNWSKPQNMGSGINTSSDEIFPSVSTSGYFYFSSNRSGKGYDLFETGFLNDNIGETICLPEPINSPQNDFALVFDASGKIGLFTSDRAGNLDIYKLFYDFPRFENCEPVYETNYCFYFEDISVQSTDSLPMRFEWNFGDGQTSVGLSAEHCYSELGSYKAYLSIYDTITNLLYARVSEVEVVVEKFRRPFINSVEVAQRGDSIQFFSVLADMTDFDPDQYYWFFGDGTKVCRQDVKHAYAIPGMYTITLGIESKEKDGIIEKACVTRQVHVIEPIELSGISEQENIEEDRSTSPAVPVTEYYIELKKTSQSIALSDEVFSEVEHEITERFQIETGLYIYSVGSGSRYTDLFDLFHEMRKTRFQDVVVREEKMEYPQTIFIKKGWYVSDSTRKAIHSKIFKFRDILFENNSAELIADSKALLDQIGEVMNGEIHFKVHIVAHTDDQGDDLHNQFLSEERARRVKDYLVKKGIDPDRLTSEGMGETSPITSNDTEEGRALNRRVEFQLSFENTIDNNDEISKD